MAVFEPTNCHLPRLRDLVWLSDADKRDLAARMKADTRLQGLVAEYGNALTDMLAPAYAKTYGPFRDYALNALNIFDGRTPFGKSTIGTSFSLSALLDEKTTVYCILPEEKLSTHGVWLALVTSLVFEMMGRIREPRRVMCLIEEAGNIGRIENLPTALTLFPGKGLRCWLIFQSRHQAEILYGKKIAALIEEQASMVQAWDIRGLNDQREWSARIGTTTRKSRSLSKDPSDELCPWRLSVGERGAPFMTSDDVGQLDNRYQLINTRRGRVVHAERIPYFEIKPWCAVAAQNPYVPAGATRRSNIRLYVY
jgi:type IV secretory pathway TraG/TraD family ATPase VirD4